MKNVEIKLRAHHGMCLAFFEGKGYSAGFTAHMAQILEYLEQENPIVTVVAEADCICGGCPNLTDAAGRQLWWNAMTKRCLPYAAWGNTASCPGENFRHAWQNIFFPMESGAKSAVAVNGAASAKKKRLCTVCDFYGRINKR